jgi:integrase
LRFFYIKVLKRNWSIAETPYPRKVIRLPEILSQEEVARLIDAAELPFYRILLMTLYGTGARRIEAAHLKVGDIDSKRMVVHIHGGNLTDLIANTLQADRLGDIRIESSGDCSFPVAQHCACRERNYSQ